MCGEHMILVSLIHGGNGSSPRVRGTQLKSRKPFSLYRFIPACAGNTTGITRLLIDYTVHPRVCGEHTKMSAVLNSRTGSSPRVRGTHVYGALCNKLKRFIPACAGNTFWTKEKTSPEAVHPRVCGEHTIQSDIVPQDRGSSPRVRGTLILSVIL